MIKLVGLCGDADTSGAFYGQMAGAIYEVDAITEHWKNKIRQRREIENIAKRSVRKMKDIKNIFETNYLAEKTNEAIKNINSDSVRIESMELSLSELYTNIKFNTELFGEQNPSNNIIKDRIRPKLDVLKIPAKSSVLYVFSTHQTSTLKNLHTFYTKFRHENKSDAVDLKKKKISVTTANKETNLDSTCLYVGKSNGDILTRLTQHLGMPDRRTGALRLFNVLKGQHEDITLTIHVIILKNIISELGLTITEAVLASSLMPALGRHQKANQIKSES